MNYKLLTGEINECEQREHALGVYLETQMSDGVRFLKSSSLEFNNNTGCATEVDTLVVECMWKEGK